MYPFHVHLRIPWYKAGSFTASKEVWISFKVFCVKWSGFKRVYKTLDLRTRLPHRNELAQRRCQRYGRCWACLAQSQIGQDICQRMVYCCCTFTRSDFGMKAHPSFLTGGSEKARLLRAWHHFPLRPPHRWSNLMHCRRCHSFDRTRTRWQNHLLTPIHGSIIYVLCLV